MLSETCLVNISKQVVQNKVGMAAGKVLSILTGLICTWISAQHIDTSFAQSRVLELPVCLAAAESAPQLHLFQPGAA